VAAQGRDRWTFNLNANEIGPRQITVIMHLVNENNKVISTASHTFRHLSEILRSDARLTFRNVSGDDITSRLTIRVGYVNDIPAQRAAAIGFIQMRQLGSRERRQGQAATQRVERERQKRTQRETRRAARKRQMDAHPLNNPYTMYYVQGGYTLGTDAGIVDFGGGFGYKNFSMGIGLSLYPGIQSEKISAYMGTSFTSLTIGPNAWMFFSLLFPRCHLSLGGGGTFLMSISGDEERISAFVPNAQAWFDWHVSNSFFLRVGYRCDFYPENYGDFFFESARKLNGIFLGHSLMFGLLFNVRNQ
jgi:hypothetical protein